MKKELFEKIKKDLKEKSEEEIIVELIDEKIVLSKAEGRRLIYQIKENK